MTQSPKNVSKGFTKAFWVSNTVELFERMAYYAVFIVLTIYLSTILFPVYFPVVFIFCLSSRVLMPIR